MKLYVITNKDGTLFDGGRFSNQSKKILKQEFCDDMLEEWKVLKVEYTISTFKLKKKKVKEESIPEWKSIYKDGQPTKNGWYWVCYDGNEKLIAEEEFYFYNGAWYFFDTDLSSKTLFGNGNTSSEFYMKVK